MLFELIAEALEVGRLPGHILPRDADIPSEYGIGRSGRRGYVTHATDQGISDSDIKRLARWRSAENAGGKKANNGGTKESYSDIMMMLKSLLRATRDL